MAVTVTKVVNQVVVSAPGPAGPTGSAFTPIADNGSGTPVSGSLTVLGGTNVTTSVTGTEVTINAAGASGVTQVTATSPIASSQGTTPVISLTPNSITSSFLQDSSVATAKIQNNAVTADKLDDVLTTSAGAFTNANITVDDQGRLTSAASGTAGGVTSLVAGDRINVSAATGAVTISHKVKSGTGTNTNYPGSIEVDAFGHVVGTGSSVPPAQLANNLSDLPNKDTAITNLGGTAVGTAVFKAADAAAARTALSLGTAATSATGDFSPVAGSASITTVGTISSGTWSGTAIAYASLSGKPSLGTSSQYNAGIASDNILQADANVADDDFLRVAGSKIEGRTAAETLSDIGASPVAGSGSIVTTGTIASGTWNATAIEDTKLDLRVDHGATFDGQGSAITASESVLVPVERAGVIKAASLVGDASGSITITVKRYTPSSGSLGVATSLGTIALSSAQHARDTTLSGWTTSLSAGDVLEFVTTATIATVTRVTVKLKVELA